MRITRIDARHPSCLFRPLSAVVILALAAGLSVGISEGSYAAETPAAADAASPGSDAAASAAAVETGERVEVVSRRTENDTLFAEPSGAYTLEQSSVAVRVRRDGGWVPVDTTLVRAEDGSVSPAATPGSLSFSGGGAGPMATIGRSGASLALSWPGQLPVPELSGDTATYPEVLPGVDLQLRATAGSYSQVLVVKDAAAAQSPALRQIRFGTAVTGGQLRLDSAGGFSVLDAHGMPLLVAAEPIMWDSSGQILEPEPMKAATVAPAALSEGDGPDPDAEGPDDGDQVARMALKSSPSSLTVVPDSAMLTGPDTAFPLYIDPSVTAPRSGWTMVQKEYPTTEFYQWQGDEGSGYQNASGVSTKRLYWNVDTSAVIGKHILGATFTAKEVHAWSCTASAVELHRTATVSSATNWNNRPGSDDLLDTRTVAYGRTGCSPGGANVEFSATAGVVYAAANAKSKIGLMLRADSETNPVGWKRFNDEITLSISYNTKPSTPSSLRTTSPTTTCALNPAKSLISDSTPVLTARLTDSDGATQTVGAEFEIWQYGGSAKLAGTPLPAARKILGSDHWEDFSWASSSLVDGDYSWRVRAYDGYDYSAWSSWCQLRMDHTVPASPTITEEVDPIYAVGSVATFTAGNGGDTGTVKYRWSLNADAPTSPDVPVGVGGDAPITLTPQRFGPSTLRVWAYDAAGNTIGTQLEFTVPGATTSGRWRLDDNTGTTAIDTPTSGQPAHPLTLAAGSSWVAGKWFDDDPGDHGLDMDGISGQAATAASVVDTTQNFSVAALLRPATSAAARTAVSQDGATTSGFTLGVVPAAGVDPAGFAFTVATVDGPVTVRSQGVADGEWTSVIGVYEAGPHRLTLYVNGDIEIITTTVPIPVTTASTGLLRLGRAQSGGFWSGGIDEVSTYAGALDLSQAYTLAHTMRP